MEAVPVNFIDRHLQISINAWDLLQQHVGTSVYESIRAAAQCTIERGGAFMIYGADGGIWRRCDYLHELNDLFGSL